MPESEDPQLRARITALSDLELARMLTLDADNYRDEALEIGRAEARRRNLDVTAAPCPGSESQTTPTNRRAPSMRIVSPLLAAELPRFHVAWVLCGLSLACEIPARAIDWAYAALALKVCVTILIVCKIEYLRIVYSLHRALRTATAGGYPISPSLSVVGHLIPLGNAVWIFFWPWRLAQFAASNGRGRSVDFWLPGVILFVGISGLGSMTIHNAMYFGVVWYLQAQLLRRFGAEGSPP